MLLALCPSDGVLASWFQPGPILRTVVIWEVSQWMKDLPPPLSVILLKS